jgi:hypothetical protein
MSSALVMTLEQAVACALEGSDPDLASSGAPAESQ